MVVLTTISCTLLLQKSNGSLYISICRKPTPTDRYLLFFSNHPQVVKEGVFSCLFHRAQTVAQGVNMVTGDEHLRGVLEGNGVSRHVCKDRQQAQYCSRTNWNIQSKTHLFPLWQDWFRTWNRYADDTTSRLSSDHYSHFIDSWCELAIKIHSRRNPTSYTKSHASEAISA